MRRASAVLFCLPPRPRRLVRRRPRSRRLRRKPASRTDVLQPQARTDPELENQRSGILPNDCCDTTIAAHGSSHDSGHAELAKSLQPALEDTWQPDAPSAMKKEVWVAQQVDMLLATFLQETGRDGFTQDETEELPAIIEGLASHCSAWWNTHQSEQSEGDPSKIPKVPRPRFGPFTYRGPDDDAAFGFSGRDAPLMRTGAGLAALLGPFGLLRRFAGVQIKLPDWGVPPPEGLEWPGPDVDAEDRYQVVAEFQRKRMERWRRQGGA